MHYTLEDLFGGAKTQEAWKTWTYASTETQFLAFGLVTFESLNRPDRRPTFASAIYGPYFMQPHLRFFLSMVVFFLLTALHLPPVPAVCYISVVSCWIETVVVFLEMFSDSSRLVTY